jgi:hypothetical protein
MNDKKAMKLALEWLEGMAQDLGKFPQEIPAIAALKERLAQPAPVQEPDGKETLHWHAFNYRQALHDQAHEMWLELEKFVDDQIKAAQPAQRTEPVGCVADLDRLQRQMFLDLGYTLSDSLYATPPAQPAQRTEQEPVAWLLTDKNINLIQVDSIQRLINRLNHAHHTDIRVRINGQDEWFEADWLKHMVRVTPPQRTEPTCPECKAVVLYECVACSSNNYPPKETT